MKIRSHKKHSLAKTSTEYHVLEKIRLNPSINLSELFQSFEQEPLFLALTELDINGLISISYWWIEPRYWATLEEK